ncbi:MAG: hypothetical protein ACRC33_14065 [Gemmataceae bacterium]
MRIAGEWRPDERGKVLPFLEVTVRVVGGESLTTWFLIDTGADRTVLCRATLDLLRLPAELPPAAGLQGIGGRASGVLVEAILLLGAGGHPSPVIHGQFPAFLDPAASDTDLLGRDILDQFRLIVSRPDNEILLLAARHRYRIVEAP